MYQPKTGQKCFCKRGIQRDNCPTCEGTGWVIDFAAIRARHAQKTIDDRVRAMMDAADKQATWSPE